MESIHKIVMEMLEILNQDGKKLGITKSKKSVHIDGDWHLAVHVWIINSAGELLIQRRSKLVVNHPGEWDISAAGHVSAGEDSLAAALRETEEEIGIKLQENQLQYLGSLHKQPTKKKKGSYINNEYNDVYLVEMNIEIEKFTLQQEEVDEIRYIPWKELRSWVNEESQDLVSHTKEYSLLFSHISKHYA